MSPDVYLPVALLCGTALYLLRRRGPLGQGLAVFVDVLAHRLTQDRRQAERAARDAEEERTILAQGLDAYNARMDRQDATVRGLSRRMDELQARLVRVEGGPDATD